MGSADSRAPFRALQGKYPKELFAGFKTPFYIIEERALQRNAEILASVIAHTGCKILLAQKAFSNYDFYPLLSSYLSGTEASGLYEAKLGKECMPNGEVHVFCGAYKEEDFAEILNYADHIVFNSPKQLKKFAYLAKERGKSIGLRINPECSTQEGHEIYDPCAKGSRLGTTRDVWNRYMTKDLLSMLDGLHFHTLCEQGSDALTKTLSAVEEKFGDILPLMKWLNLGGGHHITKADYDIFELEHCILHAKEKWNLEIYLEPGEAVALNAGFLACRVLDIVENGNEKIAILDASATCHMPDVIEMPYLPPLYGTKAVAPYRYRLGGPSCLSGDIIGDYYFDHLLQEDELLLFGDMAIYTTCKNNTFNGMPLPDIWKWSLNGAFTRLTNFGYDDFKMRLGTK